MKNTKTILISLLCTAMFVSACIEDIEYKGPDSKSMLVVNCIAQDGTVPVFKMNRSHSFLDYYYSDNDLTSGVNISIDINGNRKDATYNDEMKGYTDGRTISQGDIITVYASHPQLGSITATDTVPYGQECSMESYTKKYVHSKTMSEAFDDYVSDFDDSRVDSSLVVELDIQGHKEISDYYILQIEPMAVYTQQWILDSIPDTTYMALHFKVPAATKVLLGLSDDATALLEETEQDSQFEWGTTNFLFTDQHIKDGGKLSFEILLEKPDTTQQIYGDDIRYYLNIKLYVLSGSYYYYHKSVMDYSNADMTLMSEPVTIIHNIKGGAGILGTYAIKEFTIEH